MHSQPGNKSCKWTIDNESRMCMQQELQKPASEDPPDTDRMFGELQEDPGQESPHGKVAQQWRSAEGVWISKEEKSTTIEQFRTISLFNVEGKIFFSILSHRLSDYLFENQDMCQRPGVMFQDALNTVEW